jgi:hypothetical protein
MSRETLRGSFVYYSSDYMLFSLTFFFDAVTSLLWIIHGKWPLFMYGNLIYVDDYIRQELQKP